MQAQLRPKCVLEKRVHTVCNGGELIHLSEATEFNRARKKWICHLFCSSNSSRVSSPSDGPLYLTEAKLLWELGCHVLMFRGLLVKLANFQMEIKSLFSLIKMFLGRGKVLTAKTSFLMVKKKEREREKKSKLGAAALAEAWLCSCLELQSIDGEKPKNPDQKFSLHFHRSSSIFLKKEIHLQLQQWCARSPGLWLEWTWDRR